MTFVVSHTIGGIEFTSTNFIHSVENTYNKKIYFSDPQAPGQRGTNERLNRELRRIYPVRYNLTKITQKRAYKNQSETLIDVLGMFLVIRHQNMNLSDG